MVSTNKEYRGGYETFYLYYVENIYQRKKVSAAMIFVASKENSYGISNSYWAEGKVLKI